MTLKNSTMRILHVALAFGLLAAPAVAGADNKKPSSDGKPSAADGRAGGAPAADKRGGDADKKAPAPKREETIEEIMERATQPEAEPEAKPEQTSPKAADPKATAPADKAAVKPATPAAPARPAEPQAPPTDDNDSTAEAARPAALTAVAPATSPRRPGPYELGALDCRVLDGAGIERILPKKITTGEEPDILCRVLVTQPATVQLAPHELTLTVMLGNKATYQQVRTVRMSSVGRRALVFLVPADRISSEDAARVTMRATLSGPANPPSREVKFNVEPAD